MPSTRKLIPAAAFTALLLTVATPAMAQPTPAAPQTHQFSKAQLKAAHLSLDKRLTKAPAGITSWGEDPASGRLVVSVVASDQGAMAKAQAAVAGLPAAQVKPVAERVRPLWNIIGGQAIRNGARCSAGFNARDAAGARYVLTAGHCTELGGNWSGVGGPIGPVAGTAFPRDDYGRIRVTSPTALSTALVDRYSSSSIDVTVTGAASAPNGAAVCRSGSTTGWRCGSVTGANQTVNYGGGDIVYGLTRTSACAEPGDSGGSYVTNNGTRVSALGLLSGGSGNCRTGGTTYYQPISEVLSVYRLTLVTG